MRWFSNGLQKSNVIPRSSEAMHLGINHSHIEAILCGLLSHAGSSYSGTDHNELWRSHVQEVDKDRFE
jgi:hypothetical protein